jgi:hypothetical protein
MPSGKTITAGRSIFGLIKKHKRKGAFFRNKTGPIAVKNVLHVFFAVLSGFLDYEVFR